MDIEDNADVLRQRESLDLVLSELQELLLLLAEKVDTWADLPLIAFTHLQPAEPSTLGYRLAGYAQDLLMDWQILQQNQERAAREGLQGGGGDRGILC